MPCWDQAKPSGCACIHKHDTLAGANPCAHGSTQRSGAVDLLRAAGHALAAPRHDVGHQRRACAATARIIPGTRQVSSSMKETTAELTLLHKLGLLPISTLGECRSLQAHDRRTHRMRPHQPPSSF